MDGYEFIAALGEDEDTKKSLIEVLDPNTCDNLYSYSTNSIKTCLTWHPKEAILVFGGELKNEGNVTFLISNSI